MLLFYGYFKQINEGNNTTTAPYSFNIKEYAKWKAWTSCKDLSTKNAKIKYCNLFAKYMK
jgi:acyl-CoA-binding protein